MDMMECGQQPWAGALKIVSGSPKPGMYFLQLDADVELLHSFSSAHLRAQTSGHGAGAWV